MNRSQDFRDTAARSTYRILQRLSERWPGLRQTTRKEISPVLLVLQAALQAAATPMQRGKAATEFLRSMQQVTPDVRLGSDFRSMAESGITRGLSQISDLENMILLDEIVAILAPSPAPADRGQAVPTEPEPPPPAGPPQDAMAAGQPDTAGAATPDKTLARVWGRLPNSQSGLPEDVLDRIRRLLEDLRGDLSYASSDSERSTLINRVLNQIKDIPEAYAATRDLFEQAAYQITVRGQDQVSEQDARDLMVRIFGPPPVEPPIDSQAKKPRPPEPAPGPETVKFHTRVDFPAELSIFDQAVPLVVQLTLDLPKQSVADTLVPVDFEDTARPEQVQVVASPEGFEETTGSLMRTILAYAYQDSQPAVFLLTPKSPGLKRITLDFYHHGRSVGTAAFETTVRDRPPVQRDARAPLSQALVITGLPQSPPEPVDLELRVTVGATKTELHFLLHSPKGAVGYHWKQAGSVQLSEEPRSFLERTFASLSAMARSSQDRRSREDDQAYRRKLDEVGQNLYRDLFSPELKAEYRRIRQLAQRRTIRTLLVTSDEPWIPWEIVKPFQFDPESGETIDDDFLCVQFRLSRWLAGRAVPDSMRIEAVQLVAPDGNLPNVKREKEYFFDAVSKRQPPLPIQVNPLADSVDEVTSQMEMARTQLFHFACHGNFNYQDPDQSALLLQHKLFTPSQVIGQREVGVAKSKPLVFLNACHSGQVGFSLTGLGGWAERFVGAGASAFIGTLWEVNDELAAEFAIRFYDQLWAGVPLGEAFHSARMQIRALDDANPTWLAYTLYADPNGKAELGARNSEP